MIVAGIGFRKGARAEEILAAMDAAASIYGVERRAFSSIAALRRKSDERGLVEASQALAMSLTIIDDEQVTSVAGQTLTASERSRSATGSPSISEAVALVAAGAGAHLLGPRIAVGPVTCALARSGGAR